MKLRPHKRGTGTENFFCNNNLTIRWDAYFAKWRQALVGPRPYGCRIHGGWLAGAGAGVGGGEGGRQQNMKGCNDPLVRALPVPGQPFC